MELKNAESSIRKILDCVQLTADSDTKLYDKSKLRLKNIAETSSQIISVVAGLIQIGEQRSEANEIAITRKDDLQKQIDVLTKRIEKLEKTANVEKVAEPKVKEQEEKILAVNNNEKRATAKRFAPEELKAIVSRYGSTLQRLARTESNVPVVNKCADMLWRWFDGRINKKYANAPKFTYDVRRLKELIYAFVLFFGYNFENGKQAEMYQNFDEWLRMLSIAPDSNKWIAPYDVFCIDKAYRANKRLDRKYANLTAVVLYDVLFENGLNELCGTELNEACLSDSEIWKRVEKANIDVLDPYVNYKSDPKILQVLNLM